MIKSVCFLSKKAAENHLQTTSTMAIISITDPGERPARLPKGIPVLRMEFIDLYEEALGLPVGVFPDRLPQPLAVFYDRYEMPDGHHAEHIVGFIDRQARREEFIDLVVHCQAGISRSAAVAQFVADRYGVPIDQANPDTSAANARVLRLLNKAMDGIPFTEAAEIDINSVKRPNPVYEPFSWTAETTSTRKRGCTP